jgi:hypothetical protein
MQIVKINKDKMQLITIRPVIRTTQLIELENQTEMVQIKITESHRKYRKTQK